MTTVLLLGVVLLGVILLAGGALFYYNGPCGVRRVDAATHALSGQLQQFEDAYQIASSTARISLSGPVAEMQAIQRDTDEIGVPACMATAKEELILSMETAVAGFLAFMSEESDIAVARHLSESVDHIGAFNDELLAVRECSPFCR